MFYWYALFLALFANLVSPPVKAGVKADVKVKVLCPVHIDNIKLDEQGEANLDFCLGLEDTIHFIYRSEPISNEILYSQASSDLTTWTPPVKIGSFNDVGHCTDKMKIVRAKNGLHVFNVRRDNILHYFSSDNGKTWKALNPFKFVQKDDYYKTAQLIEALLFAQVSDEEIHLVYLSKPEFGNSSTHFWMVASWPLADNSASATPHVRRITSVGEYPVYAGAAIDKNKLFLVYKCREPKKDADSSSLGNSYSPITYIYANLKGEHENIEAEFKDCPAEYLKHWTLHGSDWTLSSLPIVVLNDTVHVFDGEIELRFPKDNPSNSRFFARDLISKTPLKLYIGALPINNHSYRLFWLDARFAKMVKAYTPEDGIVPVWFPLFMHSSRVPDTWDLMTGIASDEDSLLTNVSRLTLPRFEYDRPVMHIIKNNMVIFWRAASCDGGSKKPTHAQLYGLTIPVN